MSGKMPLRSETFQPVASQTLLIDALYAGTGTLIAGGAVTAGIAALCAVVTSSATPLVLSIATLVVASVRVTIALRRQWQTRPWHHVVFTWSAAAYLFLSGVLTFWAFLYSSDPLILTMTLIVSLVNSMGIGLRSFAIERIVRIHIIAILTPVTLAFAIRGGYFYIAALTQVMLSVYIYICAKRIRDIVMSEITYRERSETVAARFRFAIDNMSHGLCMIDREMRVVVANAKFTHFFGLPAARSLVGVRFAALVRLAQRSGAIDKSSVDRLLASFGATHTPAAVIRGEAQGAGGAAYDLTLKRHAEDGFVLVAEDVTDQKRARKALDAAARFDPVTNLPNRRSFEARLGQALAAARDSERRTEVLFLDLDGFKQVNDTLGHKIGDRVLAEAAARLHEMMGQDEYVCRWGGDEFVILRSGESDEALQRFAEGVIRELSRPTWIEGSEIVVGATIGITVGVGAAVAMDALLQQADMALYSAKREARGACRLYEVAMSEEARERRLLELDLQAALASRTFELHYQPIVDIETGELVSFEALARWRHPVRGSVSPALFVPVLEELNLMNAFGAWSLQRACEEAANWPVPTRVGVNVSSRQLDTLVDSVRRALAVSGLAPERLELEITETAALAPGDAICRILESLRAMGVRIALDDFGTGYSSLSHLMGLPLDKVKIDRSFTRELGLSRKADVLVANIARLSSQLGMRVTFEGIETVDQLERARALGVAAEGQGYLFGKAMPAAELPRLFVEQPASRVA
jgi:diguanylate cyclase (GGDEF)-like protein